MSALNFESTSTPGSEDDTNTSQRDAQVNQTLEQEGNGDSDASSYHSAEMYSNWAFDELDADDVRSVLLLMIPLSDMGCSIAVPSG